jgi:ElaB/YqjD/DUF883 family membrane-anchored ribosome-binding protein
MTQNPYERSTDQASHFKEKAAVQASKMAEQTHSTSNRLAEQARDAGAGVQEVAGNVRSALDKSLNDQPMATLAFATILGFCLGAIWKA